MKKTLYDVLGVAQSADQATLRAAVDRLLAEYAPERATPATAEDYAIRCIAVREAWHVLGDENRRAAYDGSLRPTMTPEEAIAAFAPEYQASGRRLPGSPRLIVGLLALLLILPAGWWFRLGATVGSPEDVAARQRAEVERIEREQTEGSPEDQAREREARLAREAEWRERRDREAAERAERQRQQEVEQARREADRVSQDLEYSRQRAEQEERQQAERARREAERVAAEDRRERERQAMEAKRRLERDKAYLERLQRENQGYRSDY